MGFVLTGAGVTSLPRLVADSITEVKGSVPRAGGRELSDFND